MDLAMLHPWPEEDMRARIRASARRSHESLVAIDDDPTGCQTVHDVPILTVWSVEALQRQFAAGEPVVFVLTNSRSLPESEAVVVNREVAANIAAAARATGRRAPVLSRSDSTLRGHFPAETDALSEVLGPFDGVLLAPYFAEGGRLTIDDVHYVKRDDHLIPAAETELAKDPTFGYTRSNLREWVEEKSGGRWRADHVPSIGIPDIRQGGPARVAAILREVTDGVPVVINAVSDRDLEVAVLGLLDAEAGGKRFLYRTGASFVKVRGGVTDQELLSADELPGREAGGGLTIVGSYVRWTTAQLERLRKLPDIEPVELSVPDILDPGRREATLSHVVAEASARLRRGRDAVVFTSREFVTGADAAESLRIAATVSEALVAIVRRLDVTPRYLIAKGGITAHDVATRGLGVERAVVMGQIALGVPVWRLGDESKFPDIPYIVFPGNVGTEETLADVATALRGQ
jgi:uncharacterized protein YgbK (DUF1537 family)